MLRSILVIAGLITPVAAHAGLNVSFIEGAPKDRFVFENTSGCTLADSQIELDLAPSAGKLIFDVTGAGAGVEVFQPLELVQGADLIEIKPEIRDGDQKLQLAVSTLAPGAKIAFTIDVDDTLGAREITVTGSEMAGAQVSILGATASTAVFKNNTALAQIACD